MYELHNTETKSQVASNLQAVNTSPGIFTELVFAASFNLALKLLRSLNMIC